MRAAGNVVLPFSFGFGRARRGAARPPPAVAATAFRVVHGPRTPAGLPLVATSLLAPLPSWPARRRQPRPRQRRPRPGRRRALRVPGGRPMASAPIRRSRSEVARHHLGVTRDQVRLELGRGVWLGERLVPTDELMRLLVNYRGPGRFATELSPTLLDGELPAPDLAGKVVLIGGTAAGVGERFLTPFTAVHAGGRAPCRGGRQHPRAGLPGARPTARLLDLGLVVLGGLLIGWLASRRGLLAASLVFALTARRPRAQPLRLHRAGPVARPVPAARRAGRRSISWWWPTATSSSSARSGSSARRSSTT